MGILKKLKSQLSIKNIKNKTTTIKGIASVSKNLTGVGVLQRSKDARKIALIGAAAGGAYFAAPYVGSAAKFAAGKVAGIGTKIGAVAGNLLTRNLAPGQVGDMVGPPEPSSPSEQNFYNESGGDQQYPDYTATQARLYGAASGGATASSCSGQASATSASAAHANAAHANASDFFVLPESIIDYLMNTVGWVDGTIFVFALVATTGLIIDSYLTYRKRAKAKGF